MARRSKKKNPTTLETVLWASGAAFVGLLAGYGLFNLGQRRKAQRLGLGTSEWAWWVTETEDGYVATIQSPTGARTQLSARMSRESAAAAAADAIAERGGTPVEGKPISG